MIRDERQTAETMRAIGASCFIVCQRNEDNVAIAVYDTRTPDTPIFMFALSDDSLAQLSDLDGEALALPGMNIREYAVYKASGQLPVWAYAGQGTGWLT